MKAVYCPHCGGRTRRNGRTSSGSQRWRCTACGASVTVRYDDTSARLDEFLGWLLSMDSQAAMPGGGRSFRLRTAEFWEVWPMIEGGVNSQLRAVLRNHRGLTSVKRVKAVFWWCHAHSGDARTEGRSGATGPCGRTSTTGTRTRSGWIDGWKRVFYRDTHFVL